MASKKSESKEPLVDFMADAPPERPYGTAISEEQRRLMNPEEPKETE